VASRRKVDGKNYTVLSWSPVVTAPSGKPYIINGYVNDQNLVERVETWLGENIMGDMQILATYTGWKEYAGFMAPSKIVQTRGGFPFFEVDVTSAKINPPDVAALVPAPPPAGRGGSPPAGGGPGGAPALTVTSEKLGDGLYRLTRGAGGYDSLSWRAVLDAWKGVGQAARGLIAGIDSAGWDRAGIAAGVRITPAQMLRALIGHERHHIQVLKERYGLD